MQTTLEGEAYTKLPASCTALPFYTVFLPSELSLEEFLESCFNQ